MIYFDNAATTFPKPQCVVQEMKKCINEYCGNPGRSAHKLSIKSAEKIFEARQILSDMFNAEAENVVFTLNTTYALNIAIKALLKQHSHILISDMEHNSVFRPVYALSSNGDCSFDIFSTSGSEEEIINEIEKKITHNTSMIVCCHVSNIGVRRLPLEKIGKICKDKGITFIVDAAQSAGIFDINIKNMNINALCFPAHKALYGPQGVGAVIFNNIEPLRTIIEGGTGINSKEANMPDFLPEALEAGTMPTPALSGFCEALKWLKELDICKARMHEEDLFRTCKMLLEENNKIILYNMNDYLGNTLLFNVKNKSAPYIASKLNEKNIYVRAGFHCSPLGHKILKTGESGAIRISFSVFNTKKEVFDFCDAINSLAK